MQIPTEMISAIMRGNDMALARQLDTSTELDELFKATINAPQPTNHAIGQGMTLLQLASFRQWGNGSPAELLIERGANVDLHSACALGLIPVIEDILAADHSAFNDEVDTYVPLQFAITGAQPTAIECLLRRRDNANRGLRKVAYFGWEDDVLGQRYDLWRPIHMASLWGFDESRLPTLDALEAGGADLNRTSPLDGFGPIHLVAMSGRVSIIRWLVDRGVNVNARTANTRSFSLPTDCDGPTSGSELTPIMIAAAEGFPEAIQCLIELNADKDATNDEGLRAIDFARRRFWNGQPYERVIELLST